MRSSIDTCMMDYSPLFDAIQNGDMTLVQESLNNMSSSAVLQDLRDRQGYTPMASAIIHGNLEVLRRLHEFAAGNGQEVRPGSSEKDDLLLLAIINVRTKNGKDILRFVLEKWGNKLAFARISRSGQSALHLAASRGITEVFKFLRATDPSTLQKELLAGSDDTGQNPLHLSASSHLDIVKELLDIEPALATQQDQKGETALHKAVEAGKKSIVEKILEKNPEAIYKCGKDGRNAYQVAKDKLEHQVNPGRDSPPVEAGLVESYLKEWVLRRPGLGPGEIRRLLFRNQGHEYFLDLRLFESSVSHFYPYYLDTFPDTKFECESWLKFVRLPELHCDPKATESLHRQPGDACLIFDSLRKRGVHCVLEVIVPDCPIHPHSDEAIIRCLKGLHVRHLDWRKRDLSVATILQASPEVEEVHLYSSGNLDVLSHWASYEGLYRLPELQSVDIILPRVETNSTEQGRDRLERRLKALIQHNHAVPLVYDPITGSIDQAPSDCQCTTPRFREVHVKLEQPAVQDKSNKNEPIVPQQDDQETILTKMKPILDFLSSFPSQRAIHKECAYVIDHPVKVAIIDNGVASYLFKDIQGQSFIENGLESLSQSHWHTVSNTHGTQMAALIDRMNKFRRLYIAKASQGPINQGVSVEAAVQAVKWAVAEQVDADIISMSWTLSDYEAHNIKLRDKLGDALSEAARKRLIFGATGDRGVTAPSPWPADFSSTIAIATTPMGDSGNTSVDIERSQFSLPGDDLEVLVPKYLNPKGVEKTTGSSAATALAAGLGSLILTCVRFAYYQEPLNISSRDHRKSDSNEAAESAVVSFRHQDNMKRVFRAMCSKERRKFVQPWTIFKGVEGKNFDEVKEYLRNFFDSTLKD